jgi:C4-dicarboxylate-specific signal transduction histidine kinase
MQVEAQASNGHEAVECFVRHRPDITLMGLTVAELSASVVHQANEPLTSMLANAQAATRWLAAEPPNLMEAIASIDRIARDVRAAGRTMGQIHALVKQASLDKREASIPDLISEAVRLVLEGELTTQCHCDESLPRVCVDPLAIQEVSIRLISIAIEALENDRSPPVVKVQCNVR